MLQYRLITVMQREIRNQKLQLSGYCTQQLEQLVVNGIQRMKSGKALDHAGYVMQAERNLKALVQYYCEYSRKMGTYPQLSNSQFDAASIHCPTFWPYCSSG